MESEVELMKVDASLGEPQFPADRGREFRELQYECNPIPPTHNRRTPPKFPPGSPFRKPPGLSPPPPSPTLSLTLP